MSNTLIIAGQTYTDVTGIKALDSSSTTQTYIQPSGTKQISISSNGATTEDISFYASAQISVAVPNTYTAGDEGKVVSSGALVTQGSATYSSNGLYDTTLVNSIEVEVPGIEPSGTISISSNGEYDVSVYASASVNVSGGAVSGTTNIISNGVYDVSAYASASVLVPNSYSSSDEGKVVSSGALVAQTSAAYSSNGTYDTTLINSVDVNVSGGGGQTVYTSSTGLLYTPIMTIDLSMERTNGYTINDIMNRYGNMPYLKELTLTGVCRQTNGAVGQISANEARFSVSKYPLLEKLHIVPSEIRNGSGNVIDTSNTYYNCFAFGHYVLSESNLKELTLGKLNGPYWYGGGYYRKKNESGTQIYTIGSTIGLTLKVYVASYLTNGGFNPGTLAANTTLIEYDYQTGEVLTP